MISFSSGATYIKSTLLLFGEDLDPSKVNLDLGMTATKCFKKGDTFGKPAKIRQSGMWGLEIENGTKSFSEDLKYYVTGIPEIFVPVTNIPNVSSGRLSLWIDDISNTNTFELTIDPVDLETIHRLGVQLSVTYFKQIEDS